MSALDKMTPRPWHVRVSGLGALIVRHLDRGTYRMDGPNPVLTPEVEVIATLSNASHRAAGEILANAAAMAHASEMLEILEEIHRGLEVDPDRIRDTLEAIERVADGEGCDG